jgi:putative endonuclease
MVPQGGDQDSTTECGRRGEDRAVSHLRALGYEVVERNYRCEVGELDIVARDGATLAFVEVRTRADDSRGNAVETVGRAKQRRIARVAAAYLAERRPGYRTCRFDVVGITGGEIVLIKDAFRLGG